MRKLFTFAVLASVMALVMALPAIAHHSFAAEYDVNKPITLQGTVTKIQWQNPHVYIYFDVKKDGASENWAFEGYPPNTLRRTGFARETLKLGDTVTVNGWLARDGSKQFAGREITWPDGHKIFVGPTAN